MVVPLAGLVAFLAVEMAVLAEDVVVEKLLVDVEVLVVALCRLGERHRLQTHIEDRISHLLEQHRGNLGIF